MHAHTHTHTDQSGGRLSLDMRIGCALRLVVVFMAFSMLVLDSKVLHTHGFSGNYPAGHPPSLLVVLSYCCIPVHIAYLQLHHGCIMLLLMLIPVVANLN